MKRYVLAFLSLAVASPALAKPLYITVPRAYGPNEKVVVDVAFSGNEPVELRVVKPNDLNKYIEKQTNLRRAYDEPATRENPGYFLARGINNVQSPGNAFLMGLAPEVRLAISPNLPKRTDAVAEKSFGKLDPGMKRIIDLPPNTSLVRRDWLNLDMGGADMAFTVPGFDTGGSRSEFQQRKMELDPLPPGLYVLQVVQGLVEGQVTLVVSDMTAQLKQTDGEILVRVADSTQHPVVGAETRLHTPDGKVVTAKTDNKGEVRMPNDEPRVIVSVHRDKDVAIVDTDFYTSLAVTPDVFIYADRPIFRSGDTVHFRGVVRKPATFMASLFGLKKRLVTVSLENSSYAPSATVGVDDFGCFSGSLDVPEDATAGVVRLVASIDDASYQSEARVQDYVKPTFFVEIITDQDTIVPGGKLKAKLKIQRYDGTKPEDAAYEVSLFKTRLETAAWVDDAGLGATGSAVTYGTVSTTEGKLNVPERVYSTLTGRASDEDDAWDSAPKFDDKGEATIEITVPELPADESNIPFKYSLSVQAREGESDAVSSSKAFYYGKCAITGGVSMSPRLILTDKDAQLAVRSLSLGGRPVANVSGEVELIARSASDTTRSLGKQAFKTGADGVWRTSVKASAVGALEAHVTLKDEKGNPWEGEASLLVAGTNGEPVLATPVLAADSLAGVLSPGDTAEMVVMFPAQWGPKGAESGPVWFTLSGRGIYDTQLVDVKGRTYVHRFEVEKRFGGGVYASVSYPTATGRWEERTVTYRIVPKERVLTVQVTPEKLELAPLAEQTLHVSVRNSDGVGAVAQVSVGVVDKAIYALQSEFRPRILDFFYPPVRNNIMTFYSAEFQGYGYGEALAQAMRARGYKFAEIKAPVKKVEQRDKDTAYWNANIVTDRTGQATVRFAMPSNATIWVVTAVAVDAEGRFGESTRDFASRGGLTVAASLPQFLREGDTARGFVRLNRDKKPANGLSLTVEGGGALDTLSATTPVDLSSKSEQVIPIELKAARTGTAKVDLALTGGSSALADHRSMSVLPAAVEERAMVAKAGSGSLHLDLPPNASVKAVELQLSPSLVAAALASSRELLTYPTRTAEGLVATTLPNIALAAIIEKTQNPRTMDPSTRALVDLAKSQAVQGLDRLMRLQVKSGGFARYQGQSEGSLVATLIALDGLAYAADAGAVGKGDPRLRSALGFVEKAGELPLPLDAMRTYVTARYDGEKTAPRVRALLDNAASAPVPAAFALLAARRAGVEKEPAMQAKLETLRKVASGAMTQPATLDFYDDFFWLFPIRRDATAAILADAATPAGADAADRKAFFIDLMSRPELPAFERATILLHALPFIAREAEAAKTATPPTVKAGGKNVTLAASIGGFHATLPADTRDVTVEGFDGEAQLEARAALPLSGLDAKSAGMSVQRRYFALRGDKKVALKEGDTVNQGENVYVELELNANDERATSLRSAYYTVEDVLPAGFVAVQEDKKLRGAPLSLPLEHEALKERTFATDRVVLTFEEPTWWSRSARVVGYVMRAQFPGTFAAPPAKIQDMYATQLWGRSDAAHLTVKGR